MASLFASFRAGLIGVVAASSVLGGGCASISTGRVQFEESFDRGPGARPHGALALRWQRRLGPDLEGAFLPVERSTPTLDAEGDRIYVGSSTGQLWAFRGDGQRVWMYQAGGGVGAPVFVDRARDVVYAGSDDGYLHALRASTGEKLWQTEMSGALGRAPLATSEAVYIVTDNDFVEAFAREDGHPLWRFERTSPEGFFVTEHAGLTLAGDMLITGFTDGQVVALDARDGATLWTRDTLSDVPETDELRFTDVDTTPVVVGDTIYVASFAAGLYALERSSGSVRWLRRELTGVVGILSTGTGELVLSSGDLGVVMVDAATGDERWRHRMIRGAPSPVIAIDEQTLFFAESEGGLVALRRADGREVDRFENGHGFGAMPATAAGLSAALSNAGTLFVFASPGRR